MEPISVLTQDVSSFALTCAERCRDFGNAGLRAIIAQCDQVPPGAAALGILLVWGLAQLCRALRQGVRYGEPVAARLAVAGVVASGAAVALRPYLLLRF